MANYWASLDSILANGHGLYRTSSNPLCLPEKLNFKACAPGIRTQNLPADPGIETDLLPTDRSSRFACVSVTWATEAGHFARTRNKTYVNREAGRVGLTGREWGGRSVQAKSHSNSSARTLVETTRVTEVFNKVKHALKLWHDKNCGRHEPVAESMRSRSCERRLQPTARNLPARRCSEDQTCAGTEALLAATSPSKADTQTPPTTTHTQDTSVGNKTNIFRPRPRPRPDLQDQDQDQDRNCKTKTKTTATKPRPRPLHPDEY